MSQLNERPLLEGDFLRKGLGNLPQPDAFENDVLRTLFVHHTIRCYTDEAVDPGLLEVVVSAGLHAPNAGGCQALLLLVC